ncbi:MAG: hypothetical protein J5525_12985 [Lachnospiraceae bacterium]|nr:hypothetical protein [Lachnospiraceae bacterium]
MDIELCNIFEYEGMLLGRDARYKLSFTGSEKDKYTEFGNIWRYAITHLLKWTPQTAVQFLNAEIIRGLKLEPTYKKIGVNPKGITDYRIVLQYVFPNDIHYSVKDDVLREYRRATKQGEFANAKGDYRIPKNFFTDDYGIEKAAILLNYIIDNYMSDYSIDELYQHFSKRNIGKWLKEKKLDVPLNVIYGSPLEYLHSALPVAKRDNFFYYNKKLADECDRIIAEMETEEQEGEQED